MFNRRFRNFGHGNYQPNRGPSQQARGGFRPRFRGPDTRQQRDQCTLGNNEPTVTTDAQTVVTDNLSTNRQPIPYGKQYSPKQMNRVSTTQHPNLDDYANIFGPPITQREGTTTLATTTRNSNLIKTIKPRIPDGTEDLKIHHVTFDRYMWRINVHITREGKREIYKFYQAKDLFPKQLADYILAHNMEVCPGMEWAALYGKPCVLYYKIPNTHGIKYNKHDVRHRLLRRMYLTQKKGLKHRHKTRFVSQPYLEIANLSEPMLNNHLATLEEIENLVQEFHQLDNQHAEGSTSEVALIDSACDTCAIGGTAWIIEEHTGKHIEVTGHTQHFTSRQDIPIVSAVTACDLPTGETILLKLHESSNLGEHGNTLLSTIQL